MSVPPAVHTRLTERAPGVSLVPHPEARAAAEAAEEAAVGKST